MNLASARFKERVLLAAQSHTDPWDTEPPLGDLLSYARGFSGDSVVKTHLPMQETEV